MCWSLALQAKTAEPIVMIIGWERQTRVSPRKRLLDGCTYWRHLANIIERRAIAAITVGTGYVSG